MSDTIFAQATSITNNFNHPTARDITQNIACFMLSIKNKSNKPITIDRSDIFPHPISQQELKKMLPSTYGCFFIPAAFFGIGGLLFLWKIGLPLSGLFTLFGINQSRKATEKTLQGILNQTPPEKIIVEPQSSKTFFLALDDKKYDGSISFIIQSNEHKKLYTIKLNKKLVTSYDFA